MVLHKRLNRLMAFLVLAISFATYWRTMASTVSFWDCGEFIACSYILGIPHPPGAPFYLLLGRLFSMIPWSPDIAVRVSLISVITSALTVMLTYLIIVRLIQTWRGEPKTLEDRIILYASGVLGALAFAFTDSLWFNAVEAEVYAISMFFTAIVIWLVMLWYEKADEPTNARYLLLIMYCVGLALGVHLLNILALPAIILIIYFRKNQMSFMNLLIGVTIATVSFGLALLVMNVSLQMLFSILQGVISPFVTVLFPSIEKVGIPGYGTAAVLLFPIYLGLAYYLYKKHPEYKNYGVCGLLVAITALLIVAIYPGVVKGVPWLLDKGDFSTIGPLLLVTLSATILFALFPNFTFTGSVGKSLLGVLFGGVGVISLFLYFINGLKAWEASVVIGALLLLVFIALAYGLSKWIRFQGTQLALLSLFVVMLGASTYLMIYIRSGLDPAIDENDPEDTKSMVMYLNREQYGEWSLTDRQRWKPESPFKYSSEMDYLWRYQIKRMYLRYFAWQFMGKGQTLDLDNYIKDTFSFRGLYWLPFLLGLLGMIWHFYKDWRQALAVLILFIFTGLAIVIYLNQEDPQPRERDYVFVGSFFAFALWIGIGITALLEKISEYFQHHVRQKYGMQLLVIVLVALAVPINMFAFGFHEHDRTGDYVAYDYSYNILESCEKDGILFTNGDNDTFPLWFLQNCVYDSTTKQMGLRKDVRVVNLSLLNTPWYIKQLKNQAPKVPISLTDAEIEELAPMPWRPEIITVDVPKDQYLKDIPDVTQRQFLMNQDTAKAFQIAFEVAPTLGTRDRGGIRVQDWMILNIILANKWRLPLYFAVTVSRQNQLISRKRPEYNIERYLRMDGLTFKLVSYPSVQIDAEIMEKKLLGEFLYRGLNDSTVFYNDNIMGLLTNYRAGFMRLALQYRQAGDLKKMADILDQMENKIPQRVIPIDRADLLMNIGQLYDEAGRRDQYAKMIGQAMEFASRPEEKLQLSVEFIKQGMWSQAQILVEEALRQKLAPRYNQEAQAILNYIQQMRAREKTDSLAAKPGQPTDSTQNTDQKSDTMK
ncbi:DUF2723 domain-containing protein [candidate division KSB1 bacterium]|nr:DUF2723 domain-containing protein [candidate division KSB1 bacterium]